MKKTVCLAIIGLLILTACVQFGTSTKKVNNSQLNASENDVWIDINKTPEFKITQQSATRFPPSINGTVKNNGLGRGSVTVVARIFYSGVIADEKMQELNEIKPEEEVRFDIPMSKVAQWTSYTVILEEHN